MRHRRRILRRDLRREAYGPGSACEIATGRLADPYAATPIEYVRGGASEVDMTNGWNGKPAAGEHVFVVTHRPPTDWGYADTAPFTFVDGVEEAIAAAKELAGDRSRTWSTTSAAQACRPS